MGLRPTKWHLAALSILPPGSVVPLGWGRAREWGLGGLAPCPAWESCPCLCPGEKAHPTEGCLLLFSWDIGIPVGEWRMWLWGQTQAPNAVLSLRNSATLGRFLKPFFSESQFLHLESGHHGVALVR